MYTITFKREENEVKSPCIKNGKILEFATLEEATIERDRLDNIARQMDDIAGVGFMPFYTVEEI